MAWHGQEPVNDGNNVEQEVPVEPQDDRQGRWWDVLDVLHSTELESSAPRNSNV